MNNLTYEEILEQLRRIAEGDNHNDLKSLVSSLRYLISEAELLLSLTPPQKQKNEKDNYWNICRA